MNMTAKLCNSKATDLIENYRRGKLCFDQQCRELEEATQDLSLADKILMRTFNTL